MNTKNVKLIQIYAVMQEMLESGGTVNFNPRGVSMLPTLRDDGDRVVIKKREEPLKKYDLPLYRRENGQFVLHRVIRVNKDGTYDMCGDNQCIAEKGIKHSQIVGVVIELNRKGKSISVDNLLYKAYVRAWVMIRPLRYVIHKGLNALRRIKHKFI